jgi:hypothetical protein
MLEVARFVNLVLAGLLAGNEFGTRVAIHPSLTCALPTPYPRSRTFMQRSQVLWSLVTHLGQNWVQ